MIGVFDSGLGGLTIFKELLKELPDYNYLYLGDNARVPYGSRSNEIIYQFTLEAVDYLFKKGCELIILACNTASSVALKRIQQEYLPKNYPERRVLGVIRPAVEEACEKTFNNRIGVIGTEATINSGAFEREIKKLKPEAKVYQVSCPLLVPIIEAGELNWQGLDLILDKYLAPLRKKDIGALILGCTHYSLIKDKIQKHIGKAVRLISEEEVVPAKLKDYLFRHQELEKRLKREKKVRYLVTAYSQRFEEISKMFLKSNVSFEKVEIKSQFLNS